MSSPDIKAILSKGFVTEWRVPPDKDWDLRTPPCVECGFTAARLVEVTVRVRVCLEHMEELHEWALNTTPC